MILLLAALLAIAAAMIVLYPLLGLQRDSQGRLAAGLGDLAERERDAKGALREVEFDYRLGNLEASDYQALRERYEERALSALQARASRERTLDALIERQLTALRAQGTREESARKTLDHGDRVASSAAAARPGMASRSRRAPARRRQGRSGGGGGGGARG